jgi:hypothetical protein
MPPFFAFFLQTRARIDESYAPLSGHPEHDRVDDPLDCTPIVAFLLTEGALTGTTRGVPLPECALDRPVGVRQRRQVGLLA